jgi:spermidine synthase
MLLEKNGIGVETVEIDPVIKTMARKHFGFNLDDKQIHITDGRLFLTQNTAQYDYIFIDAFNADQLAWHLLSKEAFLSAQSRLNNHGLLAINVTSFKNDNDVASIKTTLNSIFKNVRLFAENSNPELTNVIFLASNSAIEISTRHSALTPSQKVNISQYLAGEIKNLGKGTLLTDNYNPVAYQREQAQLKWRKEMRNFLGEEYYHWVYL